MPTKQKTTKQMPVAYNIQAVVDKNGKFNYKANGKDASTLEPNLGDTISWSVKLLGKRTAFQVEFPGIAPFAGGGRVIRSLHKPTPPQTVALLPHYQGNLIFKYNLSISNGWYDDPVIVPVPVDPLTGQQIVTVRVISLSADNNGNLTIISPAMPLAKGPVAWQWDAQSAYTDDFELAFNTQVPAGWPTVTDSQARRILLNLQTTGTDTYTITTLNTGLSSTSMLTIA